MISPAGTAIAATNTGSLTMHPITQTFTSTPVGSTSSALSSIIANTASKAVYISSGLLTDAVDFTQKETCGGITPVSVGIFTFTPQSAGALTSALSIHALRNNSGRGFFMHHLRKRSRLWRLALQQQL